MITETSVNSNVIMYLHMLIKHWRVFSTHSYKESVFIELIRNTQHVLIDILYRKLPIISRPQKRWK